MDRFNKKPQSLKDEFPSNDRNLKINDDRNSRKHGPHFDVIQGINGGVDKTRIKPNGDVIDGATEIGPIKMGW